MEIDFEILRRDILFGTFQSTVRRPFFWFFSLFLSCLMFGSFSTELFAGAELLQKAVLILIMVVIFTVFLTLASAVVTALMLALRPGNQPGILGKHKIRISSDGVYEETAVNSARINWVGITKVLRTSQAVILQMSNSAHVIPLRAFKSESEASKFVDLSKKFRLSSGNA